MILDYAFVFRESLELQGNYGLVSSSITTLNKEEKKERKCLNMHEQPLIGGRGACKFCQIHEELLCTTLFMTNPSSATATLLTAPIPAKEAEDRSDVG